MRDSSMDELIAKYLAGETSSQEEADLRRWVDASPENEAAFEEAFATWDLIHEHPHTFQPKVAPAWNKVLAQISPEEKSATVKPMRSFPKWGRIAAAVVVLALSSVLLYTIFAPTSSNSHQYLALEKATDFSLPDGSRVWLNRGSKLQWLSDRSVKLEGEGFFQVVKNPQKTFRIEAGATQVAVLGTSFSVKESIDHSIEVRVATGKVSLSHGEEALILTPGEQGNFEATAKALEESTFEDYQFKAWSENAELIFEGTSLDKVAHALSGFLNKEVRLADPALAGCNKITGAFKEKSLAVVNDILQYSGDLQLTDAGDYLLLSGPACP